MGVVPGSAPLPLQCEHVSLRSNSISLCHAEDRLLELECERQLQVAPAARCLPRPSPAGESELPEELVENVRKVHGVVMEATGVAEPGAAIAIVASALFPDRIARRKPR